MNTLLILTALCVGGCAARMCQNSSECRRGQCCVNFSRQCRWSSRSCGRGFCVSERFAEPRGLCMPDDKDECRSATDCPPNHCCVAKNRPIGRRRRRSFSGGKCTPLSSVGGTCMYSPRVRPPLGQEFYCPCSHGLRCEGTGITDVPIGQLGVCRGGVKRCSTDSQCPRGHCCRVQPQVRGRKRRQAVSQNGMCTALGADGEGCYANVFINPPPGQHYRCPCQTGLTCSPTGVTEVPVADLGVCH